MEENIVDEFTVSLKSAEAYVESIINQRIVHRRRRRWKDPEWMHMIEMDCVERFYGLMKRWQTNSRDAASRQCDER